ncbi:hypothetical protein DF186_15735, partial [Enterococcus hirae]
GGEGGAVPQVEDGEMAPLRPVGPQPAAVQRRQLIAVQDGRGAHAVHAHLRQGSRQEMGAIAGGEHPGIGLGMQGRGHPQPAAFVPGQAHGA